MRIVFQVGLCVFKDLNRQFAAHGGKVNKEDFKRVSRLQVLEQNTYRNPGSSKDGCAAEDLGVGDDAR